MPMSINLHRYAPELNRISIYSPAALKSVKAQIKKGDFPIWPMAALSIRADSGVDTIKKARTQLRKKWGFPDSFVPNGTRYATISIEYPAPFDSLNRTHTGLVFGYREAMAARDYFKRKAGNGGPLIDGRVMPAPSVKLRTHGVQVIRLDKSNTFLKLWNANDTDKARAAQWQARA